MTSTNVNPVKQALVDFQNLGTDDRLGVFGLLYARVSQKISSNEINSLPTETAANLVGQIQKLSSVEQLFALRDLLSTSNRNPDKIMLDHHPSKATIELAKGGTQIPTGEYSQLDTQSKLAFWYLLGQKLGDRLITIPHDYTPSEDVRNLVNNLNLLDTQSLVNFLSGVLQTRI